MRRGRKNSHKKGCGKTVKKMIQFFENSEIETQNKDLKTVELTKTCIQGHKKLDLSSNNEACYEISSKISSKHHPWSPKNTSRRDQLEYTISDLIETNKGSYCASYGAWAGFRDESSGLYPHPQTGLNFSKTPTNLEIPDERINHVASVSSKTQKDTKPIKN